MRVTSESHPPKICRNVPALLSELEFPVLSEQVDVAASIDTKYVCTYTEKVFPTRSFRSIMEHCIYFRAMEDLFEQLTRCKDDEQQRNWMLYEDEVTIRDLLQVCTHSYSQDRH